MSTRRPGLELVVSPPKSVALLGVIGRADDMHAICDAERDATMAYLDHMVRASGGRRGEHQTRTKTAGLTWATSRHATTRAGDPQIHDHVLIANVVWMRDDKDGWKALDSAFVRDHLHAATAIGRLAAARRAIELGYRIELDFGRSERLGSWQIAGIPKATVDIFSKRSREIDDKAGSGKTTLLAAVRAGFETAGYQVLGAATSGQAARGLAEGAGIPHSRTLASLIWRLDHHQVTLTNRHVIILDEAGMTDDADLGAVLAAAARAGAKLIVAGDDRQLGAVGPGGGLAALLTRHPERVVRLEENVRQHDPDERQALAELRAGSVERSIAWYANHGRIRSGVDGEETIGWMVAAWADDIVAGRDSLLLAWQRVDVAELNERSRAAYGHLGYLTGPEVEAPGGARYAAGDRIVTLQPGPRGAWVTSQRATVTAVHPQDGSIEAVTTDGRRLHLGRDATGGDRLAHAYAVTAHRAQGATVETAHVLDDGGGRELAYVAMSRARQASHIYTTAADPAEAAERVAYSWEAEHRPTWATDQGQPAQPAATKQPEEEALHAQLRDTIVERSRFEYELQQLRQGAGRWAETPAGCAARNLTQAKADYERATNHAADPALRRRERRDADDDLAAARHDLQVANAEWETHGQPQASRIETQIDDADWAVRNTLDAIRAEQAQKPWASLRRTGVIRSPRGPAERRDLGVGWLCGAALDCPARPTS